MNPSRGRRFRATVRTLLGLAAVLAVGWTTYHLYWIHQRHAFLGSSPVAYGIGIGGATPARGLAMFGEFGVHAVVLKRPYSEVDVAEAQRLFPEAEIGAVQKTKE